MMLQRRGEFGFVWFFAIFAGIVILLLAIYGATKVGKNLEIENQATIAKKLTILTDPLEAGFTSATFGTITFQQETSIKNVCHDLDFGEASLSAKTVSSVSLDNSQYTVPVSSSEKYIFGREVDSGTTYYVLSKAFFFPFKIADYVVLISDAQQYCFKDAPPSVRDELESLKIPVITFDNCTRRDAHMVVVCFGSETCDISVRGTCESCQDIYGSGIVTKNGRDVVYAGTLLYPAVFSDRLNYECTVNRLLYRGSLVAQVLTRKAELMNARDCNTNLEPALLTWSYALSNASVLDVPALYPRALELDDARKWEVCSVW